MRFQRRPPLSHRPQIPTGARLLIAAMLAISGVAVMASTLWHLDGTLRGTALMHIAAGLGAGVMGLVTAPLFGFRGFEGVTLAFAGALLSTAFGASLGGALYVVLASLQDGDPGIARVLFFPSLVIAPVVVVDAMASSWTGALWSVCMVMVQGAARLVRPA